MRSLPITAAAVAACAAAGSYATQGVRSPWYRALRKPAIQPPTVVFPVVWTLLYADLALTSAAALDRLRAPADDEERPYAVALGLNLVLNAGWCWVFFRSRRLPAATAVAALLALSSGDLVRRTWHAEAAAGTALAPYAAWCAFATALSGAVWRANPRA